MSAFLIYILKVALLTAAFVLLYHILLRRDTFHRTARIVLVSSLFISYILPFCVITIHKPIVLAENREMEVVQTPVTVPATQDNQQAQPALLPSQVQMQPQLQSVTTTDANHRQIDWIAITAVIYALGVVILIALRLLSVQKVLRIIRRGQVSIERDGCKIVISKDNVRPFSWMRSISHGHHLLYATNNPMYHIIILQNCWPQTYFLHSSGSTRQFGFLDTICVAYRSLRPMHRSLSPVLTKWSMRKVCSA